MPNLVNRLVVQELQRDIGKAEGLLVVSFGGLTVKESEALRNSLAKQGVGLSMVRNSLARRVLAERGFEVGAEVLTGNMAIAFGKAEAAIHASKIFQGPEVKKAGKVQIRAAVLEGKLLGAKDALALSDVPDRNTLNAKIVGCIAATSRSLVQVLNALPSSQTRVLNARAGQLEKSGEGAA